MQAGRKSNETHVRPHWLVTGVGAMCVAVAIVAAAHADDCFTKFFDSMGCSDYSDNLLLQPGQCVLGTTLNVMVYYVDVQESGPGQTDYGSSIQTVCTKTIGVLNGEGQCVAAYPPLPPWTWSEQNEWLTGEPCTVEPISPDK